jgi:hypothetical protein
LTFLKGYRTRLEIWLDMSGEVYWNPVYRPDISGDQNWTVRFAKPDTPVLTRMRNKRNLRKT